MLLKELKLHVCVQSNRKPMDLVAQYLEATAPPKAKTITKKTQKTRRFMLFGATSSERRVADDPISVKRSEMVRTQCQSICQLVAIHYTLTETQYNRFGLVYKLRCFHLQ